MLDGARCCRARCESTSWPPLLGLLSLFLTPRPTESTFTPYIITLCVIISSIICMFPIYLYMYHLQLRQHLHPICRFFTHLSTTPLCISPYLPSVIGPITVSSCPLSAPLLHMSAPSVCVSVSHSQSFAVAFSTAHLVWVLRPAREKLPGLLITKLHLNFLCSTNIHVRVTSSSSLSPFLHVYLLSSPFPISSPCSLSSPHSLSTRKR